MEPDDEIETIEAMKNHIAAQEANIAKLDQLIEKANRPLPTIKSEPPVQEPQNAHERLAALDATYQKLVDDPTAPMESVKRARIVRDRAAVAADAEAARVAHLGSMLRSIDLQQQESAAQAATEARQRREQAERNERENLIKHGYAMRRKYIGG